eukprot:5688627-Amphidinium_carterae.1
MLLRVSPVAPIPWDFVSWGELCQDTLNSALATLSRLLAPTFGTMHMLERQSGAVDYWGWLQFRM